MGFITNMMSTTRNPAIANDGDGSSLTSPESTSSSADANGDVSFPGVVLEITDSDSIDWSKFIPFQATITFFGPDGNGLYPDDPLYTENPVYEIPMDFLGWDYKPPSDPTVPPTTLRATGVGKLTSTNVQYAFFPRPNYLVKGWMKATITQVFTDSWGIQTTVTTEHWYAVSAP